MVLLPINTTTRPLPTFCAWLRPRRCARSAIRRRQATTSNRTSGRGAATSGSVARATFATVANVARRRRAPTSRSRNGNVRASGSAGCATLETAASAAQRRDGANFRRHSGIVPPAASVGPATSGLARGAAVHEIRTTFPMGSGLKRTGSAGRASCRRASGGRAFNAEGP